MSVTGRKSKIRKDIQFKVRFASIWILDYQGWPQPLITNMFLKNVKPCFPGLTASEQDLSSHIQVP